MIFSRTFLLAVSMIFSLPCYAAGALVREDVPQLPKEKKAARERQLPKAAWTASVGGTAGTTYNDNVFREPGNTDSDVITALQPALHVLGNTEHGRVDVSATADKGFYSTHSEDDYLDGGITGRLLSDLNESTKFRVHGGLKAEHVPIGALVDSPDRQAAEPTTYRKADIGAGVEHHWEKFLGSVDVQAGLLDYDNVQARNLTTIVNDDRDRNEYEAVGVLGYNLDPTLMVYIEPSLNKRAYDKRVDSTALLSHDSVGAGLMTGVRYKPAQTVEADIAVGVRRQDYEATLLEDVALATGRASVKWQATPELAITGAAGQDIKETSLVNTSAYVQTRVEAGAEYKLASDWLLKGKARSTWNDFQVSPLSPDREDTVLDGTLQLEYLLGGGYAVGGKYTLTDRTSTDASVEFTSSEAMLYVSAEY